MISDKDLFCAETCTPNDLDKFGFLFNTPQIENVKKTLKKKR